MTTKNPYDVLGVTAAAEEEVIDAVYESLVKKHHPDQGGDPERFKEIQSAYEKIQNEENDNTSDSNKNFSEKQVGVGSLFGLFDTPIDTETVEGHLSDGLILEGEQLTIALTSITRADFSEYVPDLWSGSGREKGLLITTHVANTSDYVQPYKPYEIRVITEDGQRYDIDNLTGLGKADMPETEAKTLPTQLYNEKRRMEPHTTVNFVSVVEEIPSSVEIDRVIYPFKLFDGHQIDGIVAGKTRYVFDIEQKHWDEFESVVSGKLQAPSEEEQNTAGKLSSSDSKLKQSGRNAESTSKASTASRQNDVLSERDGDRIADIVKLQPTTNSELQEVWGMQDGSEVYEYLSSNLSDFYERDDSNKIVATDSAERLAETLEKY